MKRRLLLGALLGALALSSTAMAQVPRKVLVEEFTNTGCPPCAATDPIMEEWEKQDLSSLTVLKYHVSWPSNTDPIYTSQTNTTPTWKSLVGTTVVSYSGEANLRGVGYYGVSGVPHVVLNGDRVVQIESVESMHNAMLDASSVESPFRIQVAQQIVGDSIISNVTVTAVGDVPTGDLRLANVFAERFYAWRGTNGRPFYTSNVRKMLPGLVLPTGDGATLDSGAIAGKLTIAKGETKSFRYAARMGSTWNRTQLFSAAFIQDAESKTVFQSEWTVPNVELSSSGKSIVLVGSGKSIDYAVKNNTSKDIKVLISAVQPKTPYTIEFSGLDAGNTLMVPANGTKTFSVSGVSSGAKTTLADYGILVSTADSIGASGVANYAFGADIHTVVIDQGAGSYNGTYQQFPLVATSLNKTGNPTVALTGAGFRDGFGDDWTNFKTVFFAGAYGVGLFTDTGDTNRVRDFISNGGTFVLSSTAFPAAYDANGIGDYVQEVFKVQPLANSQTTWTDINGIDGDPITNGISGSVTNMVYDQPLEPMDGAFPIFKNENDEIVGTRATLGAGRAILLSFEIGNISSTTARDKFTKALMAYANASSAVATNHAVDFNLAQNYPNPFNPSTSISYTLAERSPVTLVVKDVLGREVARLIDNKTQNAGEYSVMFDASKLSSGTYVYTLSAGSHRLERKMSLAK